MQYAGSPIDILVADDDPDDRLMIKEALEEARLANGLILVNDGVELMEYLHQRQPDDYPSGNNLPGLILLDLNMPRKDGREALEEIKNHPDLKRIPVVILTTSEADEDILKSYDLGVNSFITKPVTFDKLVEVMKTVTDYWLQIVRLPHNSGLAIK